MLDEVAEIELSPEEESFLAQVEQELSGQESGSHEGNAPGVGHDEEDDGGAEQLRARLPRGLGWMARVLDRHTGAGGVVLLTSQLRQVRTYLTDDELADEVQRRVAAADPCGDLQCIDKHEPCQNENRLFLTGTRDKLQNPV